MSRKFRGTPLMRANAALLMARFVTVMEMAASRSLGETTQQTWKLRRMTTVTWRSQERISDADERDGDQSVSSINFQFW